LRRGRCTPCDLREASDDHCAHSEDAGREGGQQVDEVSEEPSDGSSETMRAKRTDEVSAGLQIAMATRVMKVPRACET
jgi:hypothetical protein